MASDTDPLVTASKPAATAKPAGTGPGQATSLALARSQKAAGFPNGSGAFPQGATAYG